MSDHNIEIHYEEMDEIIKVFEERMTQTEQLMKLVQGGVEDLRQGGWKGEHAERFYQEMDNRTLPALQHLTIALQTSADVAQKISATFQQAEEEAASLFKQGGEGGYKGDGFVSGIGGGGYAKGIGNGPTGGTWRDNLIKPTVAGKVPLYMANFEDPNFNPVTFAQNIDTQGRPVLFVLHGFTAEGEYAAMQKRYEAQYGHLPESQRPIIVGINWDSKEIEGVEALKNSARGARVGSAVGGVFGPYGRVIGGVTGGAIGAGGSVIGDYDEANASAATNGKTFGALVKSFNQFHQESSINVIAHSLGNRVVMEGVQAYDVRIDNYLAVEAAVNKAEISAGGDFSDMLNENEVGRMGATHNRWDWPLKAHKVAGYGDALGSDARVLNGREVGSYEQFDLNKDDDWRSGNHYNYDNDVVFEKAVLEFFGRDGRGFQKVK